MFPVSLSLSSVSLQNKNIQNTHMCRVCVIPHNFFVIAASLNCIQDESHTAIPFKYSKLQSDMTFLTQLHIQCESQYFLSSLRELFGARNNRLDMTKETRSHTKVWMPGRH